MVNLKTFQDEIQGDIGFNEYQTKLARLRVVLANTLPSFSRHQPNDEMFRQEVEGALREYTAAENWWKTTIANSTVFTGADRRERTNKNFEAARTHLANAKSALVS